jgi:hypothetical protein
MRLSLNTSRAVLLVVLVLALLTPLLLVTGERRSVFRRDDLNSDPILKAAFERFLGETPSLARLPWSINQPLGQKKDAIPLLILSASSKNRVALAMRGGINAAYDSRHDVIFVSPELARLVGDHADNWRIKNFLTLLFLHELGHRESSKNNRQRSSPAEEERHADDFAIENYLKISGKSLSVLVEEIWNIAEGEVLNIFTQYGAFDPMTNYATHGSFFSRIASLYEAILRSPHLEEDDRRFVAKLSDQVRRLIVNSHSFKAVLSLPPGRIATFAVRCGNSVHLLDDIGGLYSIIYDLPKGGRRERYVLSGRIQLKTNGTPRARIRSMACDAAARLFAVDGEGQLLTAQDAAGDTVNLKPIWRGEVSDWLIDSDKAIVVSVDDNQVVQTTVPLNGEGAGISITRLSRPTCASPCVVTDVRLRGKRVLIFLRDEAGNLTVQDAMSKEGTQIRLPSDALVTIPEHSAGAVSAQPIANGIRLRAIALNGVASATVDIPDIGLSTASDIQNLTLRAVTDDTGRCFGVRLPGRFLALLEADGGHVRFLDSYMSATDILVAMGGRRYLVSVPYSRFLAVVTC